jgi:hypothetical protein
VMGITIRIGKPKISLRETPEEDDTSGEKGRPLFTIQNLVVLGAGVAIGVILWQRGEINSLKNTVNYLQEVIR